MKRPVVAVDIDGTLVDYSRGWKGIQHFGPLAPGAKAFLDEVHKFADIVIHSCRLNLSINPGYTPAALLLCVQEWLEDGDLPYDRLWLSRGKPVADAYVDDRAIPLNTKHLREERSPAASATLDQIRFLCAVPNCGDAE